MRAFILIFLALPLFSVAQTVNTNVNADSLFQFKDSRDGKTYNAFIINGVAWMGENLRYSTKDSWCYDSEGKACKEYGRLYTWEDAILACPNGWHLPTRAEWDTLIAWTGGDLKAGHNLAYNDSLGFSIKFGYPPNVNGRYSGGGIQASFWSADEYNNSTAWVYYFLKEKLPLTFSNYFSKNYGMMCRCTRDVAETPADSSTEIK